MKIKIFKEKEIFNPKGNVLTYLKSGQNGYSGFGEIYFSKIKPNSIKGWKKHKRMTMNVYVIKGSIKFVFYDEIKNIFSSKKLTSKSNTRLFIGPNVWFAFQNMSKKESILANFSNIKHNKKEVLKKNLKKIKFDW